MLLVDTEQQRIIEDEEIKSAFESRRPYRTWLNTHCITLEENGETTGTSEDTSLHERKIIFGYTQEDQDILIAPMARDGKEPVGSMGNDAPLAVLSSRPQLLFNYFKQLFAQVTNPPIDPIREEIVMAMETTIGRENNLLEEIAEDCKRLRLKSPILTNAQMAYMKGLDQPGFKSVVISTLFPVMEGEQAAEAALDRICAEAEKAVDAGYALVILSDRGTSESMAPLPSLLAVGGVHQHLVRAHKRTLCGIVIETGEAREVMHFCLLTGFGAGAVNPYMAYEIIDTLVKREIVVEKAPGYAKKNFRKAIEKGMLKTMSKIGISTQHSYRCAQIFEAVGLGDALMQKCFTGTASRIGGIGIEEVARETMMRHAAAYPDKPSHSPWIDPGGAYRWRRWG